MLESDDVTLVIGSLSNSAFWYSEI